MTKGRKSSKKDKKHKKAKNKTAVAVIVPTNAALAVPKIPKFVPNFTDSEGEGPADTVKMESEKERP